MTEPTFSTQKQKIVVAVSGGFDPLHIGHVRLFQKARALGEELVVILNNDHWLLKKKGYVFMPEQERKELIEALGCVDHVIITKHPENPQDMSVCESLQELRPQIFANGGDRTQKNIPEISVCEKIGCQLVFEVGEGGKIQSSSWLLSKYLKNVPCFLDQTTEEYQQQDLRRGVDFIGVNCVFYCHDGNGKFLFHKRSKHCRDEHGHWDCGGGSMEFGETFEQTVRREVKEEYGTEPLEITHVGTQNFFAGTSRKTNTLGCKYSSRTCESV